MSRLPPGAWFVPVCPHTNHKNQASLPVITTFRRWRQGDQGFSVAKPLPYTTPCSLPPPKQLPIRGLCLAGVHSWIGSLRHMWAQCRPSAFGTPGPGRQCGLGCLICVVRTLGDLLAEWVLRALRDPGVQKWGAICLGRTATYKRFPADTTISAVKRDSDCQQDVTAARLPELPVAETRMEPGVLHAASASSPLSGTQPATTSDFTEN